MGGARGFKGAGGEKLARFDTHLHILITKDMHEFVKNDLNGGIGHHIRNMIKAYMGHYDKEEAEVRKELAEIEPKYLSLKKRLAEIETEKKRIEDEERTKEKRIEEAHEKLLVALKERHNRFVDVPPSVFKFYSDRCGLSVDELREWLKEQAKLREK